MKTQDRAFHVLTILSKIGSGSSDCLQPSAEVYGGSKVIVCPDGTLSFDDVCGSNIALLESRCVALLTYSGMIGEYTNHGMVLPHRPREWRAYHTLAGALWYWSWLCFASKGLGKNH